MEVENKEVNGNFWYFCYFFIDGSGYVEVVIICLEIMLGDIGVVVNFNDVCYKDIIGKIFSLLIMKWEIFIIVDELVDFEFGIGCVKVIFVYDFNDFEMGKCYNLLLINIMNKDGSLNENVGVYVG